MEGLPYNATARKRNKINEGHQIAPKQSLDTPPGKGNLKPGVDKKVILEEKNLENVDKVDEIFASEYKGVEKTGEAIRPKIVEAQNNKTTASSGVAHEMVTSEYKSVEHSIIKKEVPKVNLTHTPPRNFIQAVDNIVPSEYKDVETDENVKPSGYVVQATDDILTSEYKSVEINKTAISEPLRNNVNITDTPSGTIAMEVESTFLDKLEKKLMENPNTHIYLRELNSGHLIVDLKPQENVSHLKIQVTKSSTGEIQFVLYKNLLTYIQPCESCESVCEQVTGVESLVLKVIRRDCKLKGTPSDSRKVCNEAQRVDISKNRQAAKKTARMEREDIRNFIEDKLFNEIPKQAKVHTCRLTDKERNSKELIKKETDIFYDNNRGKLTLNVQGANGATACVEATLTKTPSGNIAMDIKDINCVGMIPESSKECPVLLKKSPSGAYILFVGYQRHEEPNTILKRTASGQMLIVITEPVLQSLHLPVPPLKELAQEKLYKVRVKGASSRVTALPAFLKTTASGNYILVLDKEFERQFNNHIMNSMNDHTECHIELQKTASDAIIIHFDKECTESTCHKKQNALLVKTSLGNLRILVNGEEYNNLSQNLLKVNSHRSSMAFEELLRHIHTLSLPSCSQSKNVAESSFRKQSSESQLLDSDRNSHLTNFDRPIKIQKTPSGQYAVVLDKNSKKAFLIDLKNYLSVNTKGLVPVRRMGSGDIMIILDTKGQSTDLYGSLTITPSGNVYVTMDENVLKALDTTPSGMTELGSHHIIKKVKHPENKGVDTNCNTHLDACLCDSSCVCRDLLECVDKSKKSQAIKCGYLNKSRNSLGRNLPCNPSKCYASCSTKNRFTRASVTEQAPCECVNPPYSDQENIQQCYYVFDSVCSAHKILSNELLVASSPCSNNMSSSDILDDSVKEFTSLTSNESVDFSTYDWNYLPPQLPPFLGNFEPVLIS